MKKQVFNIALAMVVAGATLGATTANAAPVAKATKHAKHAKQLRLWSSDTECNSDGSYGVVYRVFGFRIGGGDSVPNSNLCN